MHDLARALWHARVNGHVVDVPTTSITLTDAYAVQAEIATLMADPQVGWKVGSTSKEAQAKLATDEPGAGPLFARYCYKSGDDVAIFSAHRAYVEAEFAFRLSRNVTTADAVDHATLSRCIESVLPSIEVVGSRYRNGLDGIGRELITADGGANMAFVAGTGVLNRPLDTLSSQVVTLDVNDKRVASGRGERALGHPLNVLQWLVSHCDRRGVSLRAGDVVTTGTCTGLMSVAPGDRITANFGPLGDVHATFVAA